MQVSRRMCLTFYLITIGIFMNIKKVSLAALASLALASSVPLFADYNKSPGDKARGGKDMMQMNQFEKLNLNEDQKLRMKMIKENYRPQLDAIKASLKALNDQHQALDKSSPEYAAQVQTLGNEKARLMQEKKDLKAQIHAESLQVLTPEQREGIE